MGICATGTTLIGARRWCNRQPRCPQKALSERTCGFESRPPHPASAVERVLTLGRCGFNASEVARRTGLPRSTVREWLSPRPSRASTTRPLCPRCDDAPLPGPDYTYLLGLYLGDGTISAQPKGVWRLRIFQTACYTDLVAECVLTMATVLPNRVLVQTRLGCAEIGSSTKHWPCLFPQAAPGRKHERTIALADWQQELAARHAHALLRGLIQSDGCRDLNWATARGRRYDYPRYSFSNASDDIRRIFTDALDRLHVHWTQPSARVISIARRADVGFLDTFIGPKS